MTLEARRVGENLVQETVRPGRTGGAGAAYANAVPADLDPLRGPWQQAFSLQACSLQHERQLIRARHSIYRAGEILSGVPIIHSGWAARVKRLSDGRRQILSFILPGELISAAAAFADRLSFFVEAITDVRYGIHQRPELADIVARDPELVQALISGCLVEKAEIEELATDLGRRRAEERVARLFLQLGNRLQALGQGSGTSFDMPLRQQHIADATGMTVIHVGRVIGTLRNEGVIQLSGGVLTITDLAALKRLSDA